MNAYVGNVPGQTLRSAYRFVSNEGQQVFQGRDANSNVLNYAPGAATIVAVSGAILSPPDYTANDGSTLTLARALPAGREVLVLVDAPWSPADTYTKGAAETKFTRRRNRIIDPGMRVSQENGNNAVSVSNGGAAYPSDGFFGYRSGSGGVSVQRVILPTPGGSPYRIRAQVTAPNAAPASTDQFQLGTALEGNDVSDLRFGSAAARPMLVRFGCRCSIPGTFTLVVQNASFTRTWLGAFTIAPGEVNNDVLRSFVIPGDVTGTWGIDGGRGMSLGIMLGAGSYFPGVAGWQAGGQGMIAGSTNMLATMAATFDLFDVGLYDASGIETGALPIFELADWSHDYAKCLRYYYQVLANARAYAQVAGQNMDSHIAFPVVMRVAPSAGLVAAGGRSNIATNIAPVVVPTGAQSARFNIVANATGDFYALAETWALNARL